LLHLMQPWRCLCLTREGASQMTTDALDPTATSSSSRPTGVLARRSSLPKVGARGILNWKVVGVAVLDLGVVFLGTNARTAKLFSPPWTIGSLGVITYLGILLIENHLNTSRTLKSDSGNRTEVRNAIAATFMILYFTVLGLVMFKADGLSNTDSGKSLLNNFTDVFRLVIVFYFGSKAVTDVLAQWNKRESTSGNDAGRGTTSQGSSPQDNSTTATGG
jgi:hypothetical protein